MIGIQMLDNIKHLHSLGYLHRDIKPENFLISDTSSCRSEEDVEKLDKVIYMIDFGLAQSWKQAGGAHIEYKDGQRLTGKYVILSRLN